jgi:hypothetical protein
MMVSILSIVSIWILRFDQILAVVTKDAESITEDQICVLFVRGFRFTHTSGMVPFGKLKGLDFKWFSCSNRERKIPVARSPVLFPGRGKTRL